MTTPAIQALLLDPEIKKALELYSAAGVQTNLNTNRGTVVTDMTAIRTAVIAALAAVDTLATAVNALATKVNTLTTKLNADAGVTDTDYATNFATNNATTNVASSSPAALTTSA